MDELLRTLQSEGGRGDQLSTYEVLFSLGLCLVSILVIALVYRFTHKGFTYSQSYVQTLVLMGLVTTLIMIVIGSNIARAFSLVGALSIIRFRNAMKETRDVGFIFFTMAVAMAFGTRFYVVGLLATGIISSVMIFLYMFNFGASRLEPERLLSVQLPAGVDAEVVLAPALGQLFVDYSIISLESVRQGLNIEVLLSVRPKPDVTGTQVLQTLSQVNNNLKVTYNYSAHTDDM